MNTPLPYSHLFFDMDGTLTQSNLLISDETRFRLSNLTQDIVVVSEATLLQIKYQLNGLPCFILAQSGRYATHNDTVLWEDRLTSVEIMEIEAHIRSLPRTWDVPDENDLIENRGSDINYSLYGHRAPSEAKDQFDPNGAKRHALLRAHPLRSQKVDVRVAGTTCLEYFRKGCDKGHNILRLISQQKWDKDASIYYGDEIFPGGSDESVYGILETQGIKNPDDMYQRLTAYTQ